MRHSTRSFFLRNSKVWERHCNRRWRSDCLAFLPHEAGWRNAKHRDQWRNTIKTYASPEFGALPVQAADVSLVMKVLEPIWYTKPETASRLRGRLEAILDWATVRGYRKGEKAGTWHVRLRLKGAYRRDALGIADDFRDADGRQVLDYWQAQAAARTAAPLASC